MAKFYGHTKLHKSKNLLKIINQLTQSLICSKQVSKYSRKESASYRIFFIEKHALRIKRSKSILE